MTHPSPKEDRPGSPAPRARWLRRQATDAELALWRLLRSRQLGGTKFRRQHPFGPYVLDFFCMASNLALEVDGSQHLTSLGLEKDDVRTGYLAHRGVRVLRFTNREVLLEAEAVQLVIAKALGL